MAERSNTDPTVPAGSRALVAQLTITMNLHSGVLYLAGASPSPLVSIMMCQGAIEALRNDNLRAELGKKGLIEVTRGVPYGPMS